MAENNSELALAIRELRDEVREMREQAADEKISPKERMRLGYEPADVPEGDDAA